VQLFYVVYKYIHIYILVVIRLNIMWLRLGYLYINIGVIHYNPFTLIVGGVIICGKSTFVISLLEFR